MRLQWLDALFLLCFLLGQVVVVEEVVFLSELLRLVVRNQLNRFVEIPSAGQRT